MKPLAYKVYREKLGTQAAVANALGVTRETISRRENGVDPISVESELAIRFLCHAASLSALGVPTVPAVRRVSGVAIIATKS